MRVMRAILFLLAAAGPAAAGDGPAATPLPAGWAERRLVADGGSVTVVVPAERLADAGPLLRLVAGTRSAARRLFGPAAAGDFALAVAAPAAPVPGTVAADLVVEAGFRADAPRAAERVAFALAGRALGLPAGGSREHGDPRAALALYAATHRLGLPGIDPRAARRRWLARVDLALRRGDPGGAEVERGTFFAHQLRLAAGDGPFDRMLAALARRRGEAPGWPAVVALLETTARADLDWLAGPWLETAAVPSLAVSGVAWRPRHAGEGGLLSATVRSSPALPQRLVARAIDQLGRSVRQAGWLTAESAPLALRLGAPPVALTVDPGIDLLRRLADDERAPLIGDALGPAADLVVIGSARGERWTAAARAVAARTLAAGGAPAPRLDVQLTDGALAAARRVIVLGPPARGAATALSRRLSALVRPAAGTRLAVAGHAVEGPYAGIAVALPAADGGALLFADAPDPAVLGRLLARLPRWESESWVLVEGGWPVALGLLSSGTSPLDVTVGGSGP